MTHKDLDIHVDPEAGSVLSPEERITATSWRNRYGGTLRYEIARPTCACDAGPRQMPVAEVLDHAEIKGLGFTKRLVESGKLEGDS